MFAIVGTAACASDDPSVGVPQTAPVTVAEERAVSIRTTGCGNASHTTGSGVIIDHALVLTAAHVVVGAADVVVDELDASVIVLDRTRDLAVLKVPGTEATPVEIVELDPGTEVRVVGGATSGTVEATVDRRLVMDVDDVRSTSRSERAGYELDAAIEGGDSGAGIYDGDDRLAGIVFAVPTERSDATFAVGASEIEAVLAVLASPDVGEHSCDPSSSQLVGPGG